VTPDFVTGGITNAATARAGTPDPDRTNNSPTVTSPVDTSADVRLAKSGPAAAPPGEPVTRQLTVDNAGPPVSQDIVVGDTLPAGLIAARATFGTTPCTIDAGVVRCELGAVPVTDGTTATSRVVTIAASINPDSTLASIVNASSVSAST